MKEKKRRHGKKNHGQSSSYHHQSKKFKGPQGSNHPTAQGSAQATGSNTILQEPSVDSALGGSSRGPAPPYCTLYGRKHKGECWRLTGACLVCGSNELRSQHPGLGVHFQQYRIATRTTRVLHHRVHRDKRHRLWVDKMLVLQPGHMQ